MALDFITKSWKFCTNLPGSVSSFAADMIDTDSTAVDVFFEKKDKVRLNGATRRIFSRAENSDTDEEKLLTQVLQYQTQNMHILRQLFLDMGFDCGQTSSIIFILCTEPVDRTLMQNIIKLHWELKNLAPFSSEFATYITQKKAEILLLVRKILPLQQSGALADLLADTLAEDREAQISALLLKGSNVVLNASSFVPGGSDKRKPTSSALVGPAQVSVECVNKKEVTACKLSDDKSKNDTIRTEAQILATV